MKMKPCTVTKNTIDDHKLFMALTWYMCFIRKFSFYSQLGVIPKQEVGTIMRLFIFHMAKIAT